MTDKKYFWLKLDRNFFKRHDIRIIESQENGKDYILFYLKLLVKSIDHDGLLRFNESIPYDEKMLSIITDTNIDIVRSATKIFCELKLMEILDDQTIFMAEVQKMIGSQAASTERTREYRKRKQLIENKQDDVTCDKMKQKCDIEKELELDKELDKDNNTRARARDFYFSKFYNYYPIKRGKGQAQRAFDSCLKKQMIKTEAELSKFFDKLINALNLQITEKRLQKEAFQFVAPWKHPSTWLNGECWLDEVDLKTVKESKQQAKTTASENMKSYGSWLKKKAMEENIKIETGEIEYESN